MKKNVSSIGNRTISRHAAYSDSDEEMEVTSLHPQAPANNFFSLDTESNSKLTNSTSDDITSIPLMFSSSATVHVNSQMGQQKQQPMVTAASLYNMMDQPDDVPYGEDESVDMQAEQTDLLSSDEVRCSQSLFLEGLLCTLVFNAWCVVLVPETAGEEAERSRRDQHH